LDQGIRAGQFRGVGHGPEVAAGGLQQLVHQAEVGVQQEPRVLRAAAGVGKERALGMDARNETLVRQQPQGHRAIQEVLARSCYQAGQQRSCAAAVDEV
jgi:hypothetical protein